MDNPPSAINTISRSKRHPHQFYRRGTLYLSPSPITPHLPGDGRGVQDFLFELAKAGLYNLNGKFNFRLQIKGVHAPLFSGGVLYREAFSLQTKGQTPESSRTAISSISLTFGCSDTDRHARAASGPAEDSTDIFCGRHDPNELKEVVFYEDGEPIIDGEPGDLRFRIHIAPHERFRREGNDLHTTVTITLVQALVSYEKTIKHLDENLVDISTKSVGLVHGCLDSIWSACIKALQLLQEQTCCF